MEDATRSALPPPALGQAALPHAGNWANTIIAAGDTAEEIDKLRRGGDGQIVVWGGVSLSTASCNGILELQYSRHRQPQRVSERS